MALGPEVTPAMIRFQYKREQGEVLGTVDACTSSSCCGKAWVTPARRSTTLDNLAPKLSWIH